MFKVKSPTLLSGIVRRIKWSEVTGIAVPIIDMSFHTVFSAKGFFTVGTGPTHVTSLTGKCKVRIKSNVPRLHRFTNSHIFNCLNSTTTTTTIVLNRHHHHNCTVCRLSLGREDVLGIGRLVVYLFRRYITFCKECRLYSR